MRTSGILAFGGALVAFLGGIFTLIMLKAFFVDEGQGFVDGSGVIFGALLVASGVGAVMFGRRRARIEKESDERGFADTAEALARHGGGKVALEAVCRATGLPSDEAQAKMRALTGKGLFDLDFDGNGQMVYKIEPGRGGAGNG